MKINYSEIELAFDFVSSQPRFINEAFLSKAKGELNFVSDVGDSDECPEDIEDADKYITLPHKHDLNLGVVLVHEFVQQRIPDQAQRVERIFSRKGAYARFKDFLEQLDLLEDWYRFEEAHTEHALKCWCEQQNIDLEA